MSLDTVVCSFCGRDRYNTLHLIKKSDVYICRDCIVEGVDLLTKNKPKHPGGSSVKKTYLASELGLECAFCSRELTDVRAETSISNSKNHICDECLMICFDIVLRQLFGERRPSRDSFYFLVHKELLPSQP
jgi:ATP-dependent protease Clp ATPase subunit